MNNNDNHFKLISLEVALCVVIALSLGKLLTEDHMQNDKYAKYSMVVGGLLGMFAWYAFVLSEQEKQKTDEVNNVDLPYTEVQAIMFPIMGMLITQSLRYTIPAVLQKTKSLMFSCNSNQSGMIDNEQRLLDEESHPRSTPSVYDLALFRR